jgi:hypothetical protein
MLAMKSLSSLQFDSSVLNGDDLYTGVLGLLFSVTASTAER